MAKTLDADQVLAELQALGDDTAVKKQAYKSSIDNHVVVLYDFNNQPVEVRASYTQDYVRKGFATFRRPPNGPPVAETEPEGELVAETEPDVTGTLTLSGNAILRSKGRGK